VPKECLSPLHAVQYIMSSFSIEEIVQALIEYVGKEKILKIIERR
jgi:hypothetical protein